MHKQLDSLSMKELQAADKQIHTSLDQLAMLDSDPSLRAKVDANLIDVVKELENVMDEAIKQMKAMNAKEKIDTQNTNNSIDTNNTKEEIPSQDKIAKLGTKGQKAIKAMDTRSKDVKENFSILKGSDNPESLNNLKQSLQGYLKNINNLAQQHLQAEINTAENLLTKLQKSNWIEAYPEQKEHFNKLHEALGEAGKLVKGKSKQSDDNSFEITIADSSKPQDKESAEKLFKTWKDLTDVHEKLKKYTELGGIEGRVSDYLGTLSEEMRNWIKDQKIYKKFDQHINNFMKDLKNAPKDLDSNQGKYFDLIRSQKELSEDFDDIKKVIRFKNAEDNGSSKAIVQVLKEFEPLHKGVQYFKETSKEQCRQLAVKRNQTFDACANDQNQHAQKIGKNAGIWMRCTPDNLLEILKSGCFKSGFEIKDTTNEETLKLRAQSDMAIHGLPMDWPDELRYKYAYWTDDPDGHDRKKSELDWFGPYAIRFKPEVEERSFVMLTSSLRCGNKEKLQCRPVPCSKPDRDFFPLEIANPFTINSPKDADPYAEVHIFGKLKLEHISEIVSLSTINNPKLEKEVTEMLGEYSISPVRHAKKQINAKNWDNKKLPTIPTIPANN